MILAYASFKSAGSIFSELCIIPTKLEPGGVPVVVDLMPESNCAVYYLGEGEAVTLNVEGNAKIIAPVHPAILYLTPDSPTQPGVIAERVKVVPLGSKKYECSYQRKASKEWVPWNPTKELR